MGIDQKRKQRKLAKKKAKRKSIIASKKSSGFLRETLSLARTIAISQKSPIHECLVRKELFEDGIGTAIISRKMPNNYIGVGGFLLDVYCLGVKNSFFPAFTENECALKIKTIAQNEDLENIHPSCARKLIEQCVDYAKNLGFNPHKDYNLSQKIFGDIDSAVCPQKYELGKDGKPFYISGPNESFERSKQILNTLTRNYGEGNYDYIKSTMPND